MSADFGINNQYFNDKPDLKGFNTRKAAGVNETFWGLFNEDKGVNGLIEKSKVLRKRIELLEKKQKLEETGIRNYAAKFKLQLLAGEMEGL